MFALLRYEYNQDDINKSLIFGPRFDSQDTWIFHSNFIPKKDEEKVFNFEFGKPGCDNKFIYLLNILGYEVLNDPGLIKTYHVHTTELRDYTKEEAKKVKACKITIIITQSVLHPFYNYCCQLKIFRQDLNT